MARFGYVKWDKASEVADLVLSDDFYSWHPIQQLDALHDIMADVKKEKEQAYKRFYGSLKKQAELKTRKDEIEAR